MPLSPIPSRVVEIAGEGGRSIPVTRWDGDPDLVAMLLLPTRDELTRGYDRYGSALAELGVTVMIPARTLEPGEDALATAERLLLVLQLERSAPPLVLAGHGIGGLLAADYLGSARPQPDLAVLIGPDLGAERRTSLIERLLPFRRGTSSSNVEATQARVAAGLHSIQVRTRVEGAGQDEYTGGRAWSELLRSVRPGDGSVYPALGHDMPNEPGWRDRVQELVSWIHRAAREGWPNALPPAPDGDPWMRMPRADATAAHEAYVATEDERLARFRGEVARRDGPELTPTREGMVQLGTWLLDTVEVGARDVDLPGWASAASIGPVRRLSGEGLWLIDGAATHVAASLRSLEPTLHWELCTDRIDVNYQRTVLAPIHLAPPVPASAIFRQLASDDPDGEWLAGAWDAWIEAVELVRRNPQAFDADPLPLDEVAVDPYDGDPWNAQIWIPEGAEAVLGSERFRRLGERIGRLKGVEELAWEDREVMLVRVAPGIDPDDLRRRVVTMLRRARKAAATEGDEPGS